MTDTTKNNQLAGGDTCLSEFLFSADYAVVGYTPDGAAFTPPAADVVQYVAFTGRRQVEWKVGRSISHTTPGADPGFPEVGAPTLLGAPRNDFANFFPKLHEIERI